MALTRSALVFKSKSECCVPKRRLTSRMYLASSKERPRNVIEKVRNWLKHFAA